MFWKKKREDRRALDSLTVKFECALDQIDALVRDLRQKQAECLPVMVKLRHEGRIADLEAVAAQHGTLVASELELIDKAVNLRAQIDRLSAEISHSEKAEGEDTL